MLTRHMLAYIEAVVPLEWHLVLRISAPEDHFASTLSKKVYFTDTKTDWKVWHFVGDLPLPGHELYDEMVYTAEWTP